MSIVSEFRKFALRGNLIDLAIGFTVGAAFTTVAKSLVNDIIMPPVGYLLGSADFADLFLVIKHGEAVGGPYTNLAAAQAAGAVTLNYGQFLNNLLALFLVAIAMFFVVRLVNRAEDALESKFGDEQVQGQPTEKKCPFCRSTIAYHATRCAFCTSELPQTEEAD